MEPCELCRGGDKNMETFLCKRCLAVLDVCRSCATDAYCPKCDPELADIQREALKVRETNLAPSASPVTHTNQRLKYTLALCVALCWMAFTSTWLINHWPGVLFAVSMAFNIYIVTRRK